jgi:hypothetical protein
MKNPMHLTNIVTQLNKAFAQFPAPTHRRVFARQFLPLFGVVGLFLTLTGVVGGQCPQSCENENVYFGSAPSPQNTGFSNTAIGQGVLSNNTEGIANSGLGAYALDVNTTGASNVAIGDFSMAFNTTGSGNVAVGSGALQSNTDGLYNTALGYQALVSNETGDSNAALGHLALYSNTTGDFNVASGVGALLSNTGGDWNTADGTYALYYNSTGSNNTALGHSTLVYNTTGNTNTASGDSALESNTTGTNNTAHGVDALLRNSTGGSNIALGESAGSNLTTGSNNIDIGNKGVAGESNTIRLGKKGTQTATYVAGIRGTTVTGGIAVMVDANGRLGTTTSSARFKDNIQLMDKASEAILSLRPVKFRYRNELDPTRIPQFGLVAEEVAKVNPDLIARDDEGKPYTVRYEAVNAMLLNEFLKEHRKVENLESTVAELKVMVKEQAVQIRKVNAQLATNKPTRRMALNEEFVR